MCLGYNTTTPLTCKSGHYCPAGIPIPCPKGTYDVFGGLKAVLECSDCPAGKYCPGLANTAANLTCAAGWYCEGGASSATPTPSYQFPRNGPCRKGMLSGVANSIIGRGGAHIHIFVFTDHENNQFEKKLIVQNMNI